MIVSEYECDTATKTFSTEHELYPNITHDLQRYSKSIRSFNVCKDDWAIHLCHCIKCNWLQKAIESIAMYCFPFCWNNMQSWWNNNKMKVPTNQIIRRLFALLDSHGTVNTKVLFRVFMRQYWLYPLPKHFRILPCIDDLCASSL